MWWRRSLPFRVVVSTLLASVLVLVLGGFLLMRQAADGILTAKRQASVQEASTALNRMQQSLNQTTAGGASIYERLGEVAAEVGDQSGQFWLVLQGPVSGFVSGGIDAETLPQGLVDEVSKSNGMFVQSTQVRYTNPETPSEPGIVVGSTLFAPDVGRSYPVYFIFPQSKEVQTIGVVQRAALSTAAVLVLGLTLIAGLVTRQVVRPVRQASLAAERLASGDLDQRMQVRGTADLASLATSMNNMASKIQGQIGQLEELSRVQRQFVSDVSHELRTPLTTVKMAADLIYDQRDELDPSAARSAELMYSELERFEALLADLLEISRFDAGVAVLTLDDADVAAVVEAEVAANQGFAERLGTELRVRIQGDTRAEIDARRVRRILRNLITNAIEHGEHRPIDIEVAGDEQAVAVTVRDHGVGFLPSQNQQVFLRFWRADPSRQRTMGGTGLGLAISLEDARLHQGWLSAWGRPGEGAQFRLTLPKRHGDILSSSPLPLAPIDHLTGAKALASGRGRG